jgi:hypothetical protein
MLKGEKEKAKNVITTLIKPLAILKNEQGHVYSLSEEPKERLLKKIELK